MAANKHKHRKGFREDQVMMSEAYENIINERIDPHGSGEPDYDEREERERRKWEVADAAPLDYDSEDAEGDWAENTPAGREDGNEPDNRNILGINWYDIDPETHKCLPWLKIF